MVMSVTRQSDFEYVLTPGTKPEIDGNGEKRLYGKYMTDGKKDDAPGIWMRLGNYVPAEGEKRPTIFDGIEDGGAVSGRVLRDLGRGVDPTTGEVVAKKAKRKGELKDPGGYDCQMPTSKGNSIYELLLSAGTEGAEDTAKIRHQALREMYQYAFDKGYFVTRRNGRMEPVAELVMGFFDHTTSRAEDPHKHTHGALPKTAIARDGKLVQIDNYLLMSKKGELSAVYRMIEARLMRERFGVALERKGRNYEIAGFPDLAQRFDKSGKPVGPENVLELFSKRRRDIEAEAARLGISTADYRAKIQVIVNETRDAKQDTPMAELRERWDSELAAYGWDRQSILNSIAAAARLQPKVAETDEERQGRFTELALKGLKSLSETNSVFTETALAREVFEALQIEGAEIAEVEQIIGAMETNGLVSRLNDKKGRVVFTTGETLAKEQEIVQLAHKRKNEREFVDQDFARRYVDERRQVLDENGNVIKKGLNPEQAEWVLKACGPDGHFAGLGAAGTGKSFATRIIKEIYEHHGFRVHGCAPSWKATSVLAADAGLPMDQCFATAKILNLMIAKGELKLDAKSLLIVDEAGMVGTDEGLMLQRLCDEAGAKLITQGDFMQFGSVAAGSWLQLISRVNEPAKLVNIMRQKGTTEAEGQWMRAASVDFSKGDPQAVRRALEAYDAAGMIEWCEDDDDAIAGLTKAYMEARVTEPGKTLGVTTQWNSDGRKISERIREALRNEGLLSRDFIDVKVIPRGSTRAVTMEFSVGDDIVFGETALDKQIRNNDGGRIVDIDVSNPDDPVLTIAMQDGRTIVASISALVGDRRQHNEDDEIRPDAPMMQHAYAMTGHAFQGMTVDYHFDIVLNSRGREGTYVCATRHREKFRMFIDCTRIGDQIAANGEGKMVVNSDGQVVAPEEGDRLVDATLPEIKDALFKEAASSDEFGNAADFIDDADLLKWAGIEQKTEELAAEIAPADEQEQTPMLTKSPVELRAQDNTPSSPIPSPQERAARMEDRKNAPAGYAQSKRPAPISDEEWDLFKRQDLAAFAEREGMVAIGPWEKGPTGEDRRLYQDPTKSDGSKIHISRYPSGIWHFIARDGSAKGTITKFMEWKDGTRPGVAAHRLRAYLGTDPANRPQITEQIAAIRDAGPSDGTTGKPVGPRSDEDRKAIIYSAEKLWKIFSRVPNDYLVKVRGIAREILERFSADIKTTSSGTAAFAHRDLDGRITGFEYKGTTMQADGVRYVSTFSKGEKNFTQIGAAKPTIIYAVESTVDGLSMYQFDGQPEGAMICSFYGNPSTVALDRFQEFVARNPQAEIHMGFDIDKAGKRFTDNLSKRVTEVRGEEDARCIVRDPSENAEDDRKFKDWNNRLNDIDVDQAAQIKAEAIAAAQEKAAEMDRVAAEQQRQAEEQKRREEERKLALRPSGLRPR